MHEIGRCPLYYTVDSLYFSMWCFLWQSCQLKYNTTTTNGEFNPKAQLLFIKNDSIIAPTAFEKTWKPSFCNKSAIVNLKYLYQNVFVTGYTSVIQLLTILCVQIRLRVTSIHFIPRYEWQGCQLCFHWHYRIQIHFKQWRPVIICNRV